MIPNAVSQSLMSSGKLLEEQLIAFRRDLHSNPELSFEEAETAAKVAEELRQLSLDVKCGVGGHGIVADLQGSRPGRTIALRADMDALPIQEETGLEFASRRTNVMHACGHDAHTSILLGAAKLLAQHKEQLSGRVRFIFQSAEEINAGAKAMVAEGVLEGVDEIYGLHNLPTLAAGKVATRRGPMMASVDRIEITLEGRGGHGAMPDQSIDPIVAASSIVMGLQTAVSREVSPLEPAVVTIGSIHSGDANNVIPHRAHLTGTIRTFSPAVQKLMPERIQRIVERIAEAYRCKAELTYIEQVPVLASDDACVAHAEAVIDKVIGSDNRLPADPTMGGEDFSVYLNYVPGCFFWLGAGPEVNAEQAYGLHHPQFTLNEDCLAQGASIMAAIAMSRTGSFE
ncbi:M20 metallopeptidase family protein [Paenibacillus eucommiae]|uniref:Hippurate hydrolase n=1 Tax=Paenibacillus eucommiae TaxID=1355755 RepID=A0ABS4J4U6_9BACL|nr:M20 family metallopeptidase [Paenibacillus eucommiae]MBP1994828.1 hippurate hydrolase [Paenibacillus eucommiae]